MAELIRVDAGSLAEVEAFLTRELRTPVHLGRVWLAPGRVGATLAAIARASAITFGPIICLDSHHGHTVRSSTSPHLETLSALLVHELVHCRQFQERGTLQFLSLYMYHYFIRIYQFRSLGAESRRIAYRGIPAEVEAFTLEARWIRRRD